MEEDVLGRFDARDVPIAAVAGGADSGVLHAMVCHTCRTLVLEADAEAHIIWCDGVSGGASDAEALLA